MPQTQSSENEAPSTRPLVWIVDDSALEAEAVRRALTPEFETEVFPDGSAVLERSTESPLPHVLVLDWVMPGISGIEVCRFLRAKRDRLPVLLLTVHKDTAHLAEGLGAGANDFVSKPFSAVELTARVRALLAAHQLHQLAEQAERARAEAERQRADAAEERARMSELYLGIIGHDLRNPLSAITMVSSLLVKRSSGDPESRMLAEKITTSSRRMIEMIGALLDVTRSRLGGGLHVDPRRNDLRVLCEQILDELRGAFPDRKIELVAADQQFWCDFDADRLGQVISNLVTNALLHGDTGGPVLVELSRGKRDVELRVINHGPPMSDEIRTHLFDPFRRGTAPNIGPGGLGLGLYISQQIVAAHRGSIEVTSTGLTTFIVRLPAYK
jgi:signal transduction histidine kinase